jgi:hypothetical protein
MEFTSEGRESRWSDTYRGHHVAAQCRNRVWQLQLNHQVLDNREFETVEEAAAWLRRCVDALIAESVFPGLRIGEPGSSYKQGYNS